MIDFTDREEIVICTPSKDYNRCHCINKLTVDLDRMSDLHNVDTLFRHYILNTELDQKENMICIRVPGGTVGYAKYDENNIITEIKIDTNYVVKSYWRNVNKHIQKYVGQKIIFESKEEECD